MSEEDGGSYSVDDGLGDAEACCQLNHDALLLRVRKMCDHQGETCIPRHDVPVALVVDAISREKRAATWGRLCREGGRPSVGVHVSRAIRNASSSAARGPTSSPLCPLGSAQQRSRRPLTWEDQYPRSRYRGYFQPPIYEDGPSDSSQDVGEDDNAASLKR